MGSVKHNRAPDGAAVGLIAATKALGLSTKALGLSSNKQHVATNQSS